MKNSTYHRILETIKNNPNKKSSELVQLLNLELIYGRRNISRLQQLHLIDKQKISHNHYVYAINAAGEDALNNHLPINSATGHQKKPKIENKNSGIGRLSDALNSLPTPTKNLQQSNRDTQLPV